MKLFVDGKVEEALELLKQNTVMTPGSIDTLKVTIAEQMENIFPQFGKMQQGPCAETGQNGD